MSSEDREKWDARYASERPGERVAPARLNEIDSEVPRAGRALDVAAGSGRLALWAARRGLEATAVDVSPVGLALAREAAEAEGLAMRTLAVDLEQAPLPDGPFALITCFHYRQPDLWPAMKARLASGGVIVSEILTARNLERHAHPSRRWLAEPNELLGWCDGLEIVFYREGWLDDRNLARIVARRSEP